MGGVGQINEPEIPAPMMRTAVLLDLVLDVMMNDCKQFSLSHRQHLSSVGPRPFQRCQRSSRTGLEWSYLPPWSVAPFLYENEDVGHWSGVCERFAWWFVYLRVRVVFARVRIVFATASSIAAISKTQRMQQWRCIWLVWSSGKNVRLAQRRYPIATRPMQGCDSCQALGV